MTPHAKLAEVTTPPMFIIPEKGVESTDLYWQCGTTTTVAVPFMTSVSGWMTSDLWLVYAKWICAKIRVEAGIKGSFALFSDCCAAHISLPALDEFRVNDVHILTFPSNATHLLQPLDVEIFGGFSTRLKSLIKQHINSNFNGDLMRHKASMSTIVRLCQEPWERATVKSRVLRAFSECGLAPIDVEKVDQLLQVSARENDRIEVDSQPLDVPDVPALRAVFGEFGERPDELKPAFTFKDFVDPERGMTLQQTLNLFLFVNRTRLLQPFIDFGCELLSRAEAADYGTDGYVQGTLDLPPRIVLGPVHTPRPKPVKVSSSIFAEMGSRVMTSDDVLARLKLRQDKEVADDKAKEERKAARVTARAKREADAATAAQAKAAQLASESALRDYAHSHDIPVQDNKVLSKVQLTAILKRINPSAARTGSRADLLVACVAALASSDFDDS